MKGTQAERTVNEEEEEETEKKRAERSISKA
jgi:hypothetical protein